jgi:hypothetical protein
MRKKTMSLMDDSLRIIQFLLMLLTEKYDTFIINNPSKTSTTRPNKYFMLKYPNKPKLISS